MLPKLNQFIFKDLVVIALSIILCSATQQDKSENDIKTIASGVKKAFAPDKRVKVFDVIISNDNGSYTINGYTTEAKAKDSLLSALQLNNIDAKCNIVVLPDPKLGGKIFGVATQSVINLRMDGEYSAEAGTQVMMGTPLKILRKEGGWSQVVTPEGYISWVTSGSVAEMNKEELAQYINSDKVILTSRYQVVTEKPKEGTQPVCDAVWGNIFLKLGKEGKFIKVGLADGRNGFLPAKSVENFDKWIESREPVPESIINTAKQFVGVPYMWGATSIKAVDCSGFTKSVYFLNGIILARDASQQCYTGDNISITNYVDKNKYTLESLSNLKTGDLIFFGRKATAETKERITHVGIYIGNGIFIHSAGKVRINSLIPSDSNYYDGSVRLVRAQRILGNEDENKGIITISNSIYKKNN